jgi:hypothetical protein
MTQYFLYAWPYGSVFKALAGVIKYYFTVTWANLMLRLLQLTLHTNFKVLELQIDFASVFKWDRADMRSSRYKYPRATKTISWSVKLDFTRSVCLITSLCFLFPGCPLSFAAHTGESNYSEWLAGCNKLLRFLTAQDSSNRVRVLLCWNFSNGEIFVRPFAPLSLSLSLVLFLFLSLSLSLSWKRRKRPAYSNGDTTCSGSRVS